MKEMVNHGSKRGLFKLFFIQCNVGSKSVQIYPVLDFVAVMIALVYMHL